MQDKTNNDDVRIKYELPANLDESQADLYWSAVESIEEVLDIITEIQENRKNKSGEVCKPITSTQVNTIRELNTEYLIPAVSVFTALEDEQK
jgi:predicted transcriptional regulator